MLSSPFDEPDYVEPAMVEIRSIDDAIKLVDDWAKAYAALHREITWLRADLENARTLAANYEALYTLSQEK